MHESGTVIVVAPPGSEVNEQISPWLVGLFVGGGAAAFLLALDEVVTDFPDLDALA